MEKYIAREAEKYASVEVRNEKFEDEMTNDIITWLSENKKLIRIVHSFLKNLM